MAAVAGRGPTADPQPFPGEHLRPAAPCRPELQPAGAGRAVWRLPSTPSAAVASPDPRGEPVGASRAQRRPGPRVRRRGGRALRSRGPAGGRRRRRHGTHSRMRGLRPEAAILINGSQARGTVTAPDSQLSAEGKRPEGARTNGAGACGPGELVRGAAAGGGPMPRAPSPGAGVRAGRAGGGTEPGPPKLGAILRTELVTRVGGPLLRQRPGSFATAISFFTCVPPPPTQCRLRRSGRRVWAAPQTPASPEAVLSSTQGTSPRLPRPPRQSAHVPRGPRLRAAAAPEG